VHIEMAAYFVKEFGWGGLPYFAPDGATKGILRFFLLNQILLNIGRKPQGLLSLGMKANHLGALRAN
jgi:hypothetical protein